MQNLKFLNFYKWEKTICPAVALIAILICVGMSSLTMAIFLSLPLIYHIYCAILLWNKSEDFLKNRLYSDLAAIGFGCFYTGYSALYSYIMIRLLSQGGQVLTFLSIIMAILPMLVFVIGLASVIYSVYSIWYFKKHKKEVQNYINADFVKK